MDESELFSFLSLSASSKSAQLIDSPSVGPDLMYFEQMNVTWLESLLSKYEYEMFAAFPGLCVPISGHLPTYIHLLSHSSV